MASSQRPGEITYYEELGVEENASPDEIRDAFRALARLLHPDQQSDPQLKEMAERQMRKLNRIYAVLSDADRRTAYDESLDEPRSGAPVIVFSNSDGNLKKLIVRGSALAGIVFGAALLIWFFSTSNSTEARAPEPRALSTKSTDGPDDAGEQIARLRDQLRAAEAERNTALEELSRLSGKPATAPDTEKTANESVPKEPAHPAPAASTPANTNAAQFAGLWVFTKGNASASLGGKSQYPPEFIELTMAEKDGVLHGQYHARYQVLDHAISPDVDFTFSGTPAASALNCAWQGPGGARGRMTLKLLPANSVQVDWNAAELGSQQWLTAGTATLSKK